MKSCIALRHVAFEDIGAFAAPLAEAGYALRYHDVGVASWPPQDADLVIVLGGPIGVYEEERYPFLAEEKALLARRLKAARPTLGICLGAQLMAAALGARVYPGGGKEIGWAPVALTEDGARGALAPLAGLPLLHWHGDSFDLPDGATLLASTARYRQQAFSLGRHALACQFHPEADGQGFERWLVGHGLELASAGIDVTRLRADAARCGPAAGAAGCAALARWLADLDQ